MTYARLALALAVLACGQLRASEFDPVQFTLDAKASLVRAYKDPGSAQFRDTYVIRWNDHGREVYSLCGEVNAKNSYGAYVGFRPFFVDMLPSGELSPSSALNVNPTMKERFAIDLCTGKLRPVTRIN
ncbi:MAG: hypothetical protein ABWY07_04305 [Burkholderiales bacterium]|jgi:hypothetical protein